MAQSLPGVSRTWRDGDVIHVEGVFTADGPGQAAADGAHAESAWHQRGPGHAQSRYDVTQDEHGNIVSEQLVLEAGRIIGAVVTMYPAFAEATITAGDTVEGVAPEAIAASVGRARELAYAADNGGVVVHRAAFADPVFDGLTPFTVTPLGDTTMALVAGHIAPWGVCHLGIQHECQTAPRSASGYQFFHVGQYQCVDGPVAVGRLTMGGLHADRYSDGSEAGVTTMT